MCMIVGYIYYSDHDERYAHLPKGERSEFPDALKLSDGSIIPRAKTIAQLFKDRRYDFHSIWIHAVDVPISRAEKYACQF